MKIAVIGGGASGIVSAIYAKRINKENSVTVFERSDRILKKLLATGNGRCNLSNTSINEDNYFSSSKNGVKEILSAFTPEIERQFFESIGIIFTEEDGRIYPYSKRANSVLDAFRFECGHLKIDIRTNSFVDSIKKSGDKYIVLGEKFDRIILSVGANAAPSFGTDGNGLLLLKSLDQPYTDFSYGLCPVKVKENTKTLKGIRAKGVVSLYDRDKKVCAHSGEIQFTDYGLSGIAVMQLSHLLTKNSRLFIDLVPIYKEKELVDVLKKRRAFLSHLKAEDFLSGFFHKSLSHYILMQNKIDPSKKAAFLDENDISLLAKTMKALPFTFLSVMGKEQSQASAGGALLEGFNTSTLESIKHKGLYCTGELLDVLGECGGYNLHWAWATAFIAGQSAGGKL